MDLKAETLGLALAVELPLIVIDIQRAGPSTGMPTKTEQADLLMALYGRHGEAPVPILAPATPSDCFAVSVDFVLSFAMSGFLAHVRRHDAEARRGPRLSWTPLFGPCSLHASGPEFLLDLLRKEDLE